MHPSLAGGFNREWGQYLPEADAAAMGSVLVYENPGLSAEALRTLEWRGVGARRAEGFGRIAFNLHGDSESLKTENRTREVPDPHEIEGGTPGHAIAGQMADRMLRRQLDLALSREVETLSLNTDQVSNSQIGGLRALLKQALLLPKKEEQAAGKDEEFDERRSLERGRDLVREYLEDAAGPTGARSRLEDATIQKDPATQESGGPTPLLEWTRQRVEDGTGPAEDPSIWDMLLRGEESRPAIGTVQAELTDRLVYIYNLRLAHDVLAWAGENDSTDGENA
jgi:CRISPR-associated protein Csx10